VSRGDVNCEVLKACELELFVAVCPEHRHACAFTMSPNFTSNFFDFIFQTSMYFPTSDLSASFFQSVENQTAPTIPMLLNGPATSLPMSKFHIHATKSSAPLASSVLSTETSTQLILHECPSKFLTVPVSTCVQLHQLDGYPHPYNL